MASPLQDLDELILRCRDQRAKVYVAEAVASYKAGAFRSAIVAAWIAVCFDVIEKLRELALAGDAAAEQQVKDLEIIQRTGDVTRALKFEREMLDLAHTKFELISPLELVDLERLQEDRNRCAHPSLTADDQAYQPPAELARVHIHSAVTHLLQHPPVQGKHALERLVTELESEYFPTDAKQARIALESGPMRRPRESLVRNLIIVVVKALLANISVKRGLRFGAALTAISQMQPTIYSQVLGERASALVRAVEDSKLLNVLGTLRRVPNMWEHLEADVRLKLENYVSNLPAEHLEEVELLLSFKPLQEAARSRVKKASRKELNDTVFLDSPREIIDRWIDFYLSSTTFESANSWAKKMTRELGDFKPDHVRRLLREAATNSDIAGSFQLGPLISTLRSKNIIPQSEFNTLLRENDLEQFAPDEEEDDPDE